MKDIVSFLTESNNVPIFSPDSDINCDGKTLKGALYKNEFKVVDHAESYDEAVTMIERDCTDADKLYFLKWNKFSKYWEAATITYYWTKKGAKGDEILVSSEGDGKTKERLEKDFNNKDYVLVVVGEER